MSPGDEPRRFRERLKAKDSDAWRALADLMIPEVLKYLLSRGASEQAAHELALAALSNLSTSPAGLDRDEEGVRVWLLACARHLQISAWRKSRRSVPLSAIGDTVQAAGRSPVESAETKDLVERLGPALGRLDDDDREIIMLHHLQELAVDKIAEVLNLTYAAANSRLCRARQALRIAWSAGLCLPRTPTPVEGPKAGGESPPNPDTQRSAPDDPR